MDQTRVKSGTASFIFGALLVLFGFTSMGSGVHLLGINSFWRDLAFIFLGLFLIGNGLEWRILGSVCGKYSILLANDPSGSIANLAQATNASEKTVKDNLNLMIKKGVASNIAINEQDGAVVVNNRQQIGVPNPETVVIPSTVTQEKVTVACSGCGAKAEVTKGSTAICEHCGTPIQA